MEAFLASLPTILEGIMMAAFGASWPAQILKTIKVKNPAGKSFLFLYLIMTGYLCGIAGMILSKKINLVLWIGCLDLAMVATDTALSHYYAWKIRKAKKDL